jgi:hypothetical protein
MNRESNPKVGALLSAAWSAGNTAEGVALAEEAVRHADADEQVVVGYRARNQLIQTAVFSGFYEKALVAFSWCLAKADERPADFSVTELLWNYKWVIEEFIHFPRISREQMLASLKDFQARCVRAGYNARSALFLRWLCELWMGHSEEAEENLTLWKRTRKDGMTDCEACEQNRLAEFHATLGDHEAAIRAARPILSGRMSCAEIPHLTYAMLLRSFWLTGKPEMAEEYHKRGYRLVRNNHNFIREQSWHLAHLLRSKELEEAAALVRKHLPWALETKSLDNRFFFLVPARICAQRLMSEGVSSLRCRLPKEQCAFASKGTVPLKALVEWLSLAIDDLGSQFDKRNGNNYFSGMAPALEEELS